MLLNQNCITNCRWNNSWPCWRIMKLHWGQPAHSIPDMQMLSALNQPITRGKACALSCENEPMWKFCLCVWVCLHLCDEIAGCFLSLVPVRKVPSSGKCFTHWLSASQPQWFISVLWALQGPFGSKYTLRSCLVYHCSHCTSLVKEVLFYFN